MRWKIVLLLFLFFGFYSVSNACSITISPATYQLHDNPITAQTTTCTDELGIYEFGSSSAPTAYNATMGANYGSVNLNSVGWTTGSFTTSTHKVASYMVVVPQNVSCFNLSYAACSAANANIPGSQEADFNITSATTSAATSTPVAVADLLMWQILLILDAAVFIVVYWFVTKKVNSYLHRS